MRWTYNGKRATVGDWITLKAKEPKRLEIMACDNNARNAGFIVLVQEEGADYPNNWRGEPLLPIFKMDTLSHDELDVIYRNYPEGEVDFINGPIFRGY